MWITSAVDLPEALVHSLQDGRLVIFVGAGASMGPPANLPDFQSLARDVATESAIPCEDEETAHPDLLLARLHDSGFDVHARVKARIEGAGAAPNRIHHAVARLAKASGKPRVVTTNFDRHLSAALASAEVTTDEFQGPALPMGDDFQGVVYLHGSVSQESSRLVVTEEDFGRAYLRDAWAPRFLERMFSTYDVLFVGYSLNDVVMRYLARSLRPGGGRFMLLPHSELDVVRAYRVEPVGYPMDAASHRHLVEALERWAEEASWGLLDHQQRVRELLREVPSGIPHEMAYLEGVLSDPARVPLFCATARSIEWLGWASARPTMRQLFDPTAIPDEVAQHLARWFTQNYAVNEELSQAALNVVQEATGQLSAALWDALGLALHRVDGWPERWLWPWIVLLAESPQERSGDWIEYSMSSCRFPEEGELLLYLFERLTRPRVSFGRSWALGGAARLELVIEADHYWLNETWEAKLKPNLEMIARPIMTVADAQLRRFEELSGIVAKSTERFDPLSFRRTAIAPHEQDSFPEAVDVLIDAARDSLAWLLEANDPAAVERLTAWAESTSLMLQRLSIHGWSLRRDVDPGEKLAWLRASGWLGDYRLRHEVFELLRDTLAAAPIADADAVIGDVVGGVVDATGEHPYETYNTLVWCHRAAPSLQSAADALAEIQALHPEWQERNDPDLVSSIQAGFVPTLLPEPLEAFHRRIQESPEGALVFIARFMGEDQIFSAPTWDDAMSLVTQTVAEWPQDGLDLVDTDESAVPVLGAIVNGWSRSDPTDEVASEILNRLLDPARWLAASREICWLLAWSGRVEGHPHSWRDAPEAHELATVLWDDLAGPIQDRENEEDWYHRAINEPAGQLTEFWIDSLTSDWRSAGTNWTGLPEGHQSIFERVLQTPDEDRTGLAMVVLVGNLHLFYAADADWARDNILGLLDWSDEPRARRNWSVYGKRGQWNDRMLADGLLRHYRETARRLEQLDAEAARGTIGRLAGIALTGEPHPDGWLDAMIVALSAEHRALWAHQVTWILDDRAPAEVAHQWDRWIRGYWHRRVQGIPCSLTVEEASEMSEWPQRLGRHLDEAVELAISARATFIAHSRILRDIVGTVPSSPAALGALIAHLLPETTALFWPGHDLAAAYAQIAAGAREQDLRTIREEALRLGFNDAPDW